jgi:hypothetical protein
MMMNIKKTHKKGFKNGALAQILQNDLGRWNVDLYDFKMVKLIADYEYQEDAIQWCIENDVDAFYEKNYTNSAGIAICQVIEVKTKRVVCEVEQGLWPTFNTLKELLEKSLELSRNELR